LTVSIRLKLVIAFNIFLAALAVLGFLTYSQLDRSKDISERASARTVARVEHAAHLAQEAGRARSLSLAYILESDPAEQKETGDQLTAVVDGIDGHLVEYEKTFADEPVPEDLQRFEQEFTAYLAVQERMLLAADEGRGQDALALYATSEAALQSASEVAHDIRHAAYEDAQAATSDATSLISRTQYILIGGLLAAALLIFAIGHPSSIYISNRVRALLEATRRVSRGDLDESIAVDGRDEFGALAKAFDGMVGSLRAASDDVSRLHREALAMREERIDILQDQMTKVVKSQEEERHRVARELHDQAGQALTALQMGLSRLEAAGPTPQTREQAASLRALALEAMEIIRNLALDLRPSALDELGLAVALKDYVDTFARRTGIEAHLDVSGNEQRLPAETEITLFRITQEGLTNVAKHARASLVTVTLAFNDAHLGLVIEDDGVGFDTRRALGAERRRSLGIIGMRERSHLIGGELNVESRPSQGTRLVITVPLGDQDSVPKQETTLAAS
jgi:signal transduction histidine kinase